MVPKLEALNSRRAACTIGQLDQQIPAAGALPTARAAWKGRDIARAARFQGQPRPANPPSRDGVSPHDLPIGLSEHVGVGAVQHTRLAQGQGGSVVVGVDALTGGLR